MSEPIQINNADDFIKHFGGKDSRKKLFDLTVEQYKQFLREAGEIYETEIRQYVVRVLDPDLKVKEQALVEGAKIVAQLDDYNAGPNENHKDVWPRIIGEALAKESIRLRAILRKVLDPLDMLAITTKGVCQWCGEKITGDQQGHTNCDLNDGLTLIMEELFGTRVLNETGA